MRVSALKRESSPEFSVARPDRIAEKHERDLGKAVLAGMVGGLIGTIVMTEVQNAWNGASEAIKSACRGAESKQKQRAQQPREDATMKAAGKIAEFAGRKLSFEQRKKFGPLIHYTVGTLQGGMYGAVTEMARVDGGILPAAAFGGAVFGLVDELAVPKLGLSGKASEYPVSTHAYALLSHLVYGFSTEFARRGLRSAL